MNFKLIGKILGKILVLEAILMAFPLAVAIIYKEGYVNILAYAIPIFVTLVIGFLLQRLNATRKALYQKEGFALVALVWIFMTLFGAIPLVISKDVPNYIDATFEIMSGFTTTGASIINDFTKISHSGLFWRSFTHWIGGMGILVFILIFIPESNDGSAMHLLKAESPGPQVGKLASKMRVSARILYLIYLAMTIIEVVMLLFSKPVVVEGIAKESDHLFYCLLTAFGSAGTGGFGFLPGSMEYFSPYAQYVIATFLILFGVNFSLYFLLLVGKLKSVLKSDELKAYFGIIIVATAIIFGSLVHNKIYMANNVINYEESFRHAYFQVASLMTSTGYTTTDFDLWPVLSQTVLIILMIIGAMAGSTGGGIKVSRIVIAFKGVKRNIIHLINPRKVTKTEFEGKVLDDETTNDVFAFITLYFIIAFICILLLSFDTSEAVFVTGNLNGELITRKQELDFKTHFTATISCLSNIGPAFGAAGPYSSFDCYNYFSKIVLTLAMLIGRLEILPVLILFSPKTWKK